MKNKLLRKLGIGMTVIMTVSQMSGIAAMAAPEDDWDETEFTEEDFDEPELFAGTTTTAAEGTTVQVKPHFNESFTLHVDVTETDPSYEYLWFIGSVTNNGKTNNNTDTYTEEYGFNEGKQSYFFCVYAQGETNINNFISKTVFKVSPTNDLNAHVKGEDFNVATKDILVPYGGSVTLEVEASAHDESHLSYKWRNNKISDLEAPNLPTYTVSSVTQNDTYACVVSDALTSLPVTVKFKISIDNAFVAYPDGEDESATQVVLTAERGEQVTLKVNASCADNVLTYYWGQKGAKVSNYTTVVDATDDNLTVTVGDEMHYRCTVSDQYSNYKHIVFIVKPETSSTDADKEAAETVKTAISSIGTVEYTDSCKALIDAARSAYNGLTTAQRTYVTNYKTLTEAEEKYDALKAVAEQSTADQQAAGAVINAINAIGTVEYTEQCKALIDTAREKYDDLSNKQKELVTNADKLTAAEADYATLKAAAAQAGTDQEAANAVIETISAIGNVVYTPECKTKIETARSVYNNLTASQKQLVTNYGTLTKAEQDYALLKAAAEQAGTDQEAANAVIELISAIGTVTYSNECKTKIDTARAAYNRLNDTQKALVTNIAALTRAEETYAALKEAASQTSADQAAANNVIGAIAKIGTVSYTDSCKAKIDTARSDYEKLSEAQKKLVTNYSTLTTAEARYAELKTAAEEQNADQIAANTVIAAINDIGTVTYTDASKAKIDAARTAYNKLTDAQKSLVSNSAKLITAETTYSTLKSNAEQAAADQKAANSVIEAINAIGTVTYTDACKAKIDAARAAYNQLNSTQKQLVTNSDKLSDAEIAYATLKAAAVQAGTDQAAAAETELAIAGIGTVTYTDACKAKIDAARTSYNNLTDAQKAFVSNVGILQAAETEYANLKADYEKETASKEAVQAVENKISAIGTVSYSNDSKSKIDAARTAYNRLTNAQKESVSNINSLLVAEAQYEALKAEAEQKAADQTAAASVVNKIAGIGTVEYTLTSKEKIDNARSAYDKLTDSQKALVTNYSVLTNAEKAYQDLLNAEAKNAEDVSAAKAVSEKINSIGTVSDSDSSKSKIDEARSAYNNLTDAQKKLVDNYSVLISSEKEYETLKEEAEKKAADIAAANEVIGKISNIGTVAFSGESKAKIDEARNAYEQLTADQKALVLNYDALTAAEQAYAEMMNAAITSAEDAEAAAVVIEKIDAIGTVDRSDNCKARIAAAREAYDNLTENQKMLVLNYSVLTVAENLYETLINTPEEEKAELIKKEDGSLVYCINGVEQRDYSGLVCVDENWYYVVNGVVDVTKLGFVDYEGSKFVVVYGELETNANGLVQDPEHTEDWYFCANGQVQSQYTGLALYDGEWFYINQGKLDTTLADYVAYDGGLFYVAAGRILSEVNGLAKDPDGADWYFLANGQAQIQYTGLALYDDAWFYVINGKLAEDYSGTVEYDGATFNVVNGMVQ